MIYNSTYINTRTGEYRYVHNADRVKNETGTKITACNEYTDEQLAEISIAYAKALAPEVEELRKTSDPGAVLYAKYDPSTWEENAHLHNLWKLLQENGFNGAPNQWDPILSDLKVRNGDFMDAAERRYQRQMVNKQIDNLFAAKGIAVPQNENFSFTVDEHDHVTVSGNGSKELMQQMENALNEGSNGRELANHIRMCMTYNGCHLDWPPSTSEAIVKYDMDKRMKEYTGYYFSDCTRNEQGQFVLPDGRNAWQVYKKGSEWHFRDSNEKDIGWRLDEPGFKKIEANPEKYPDMVFQIDYRNGSLYDKGKRQYGEGQTGWIDEMERNLEVFDNQSLIGTKTKEAYEGINTTSYWEGILLKGKSPDTVLNGETTADKEKKNALAAEHNVIQSIFDSMTPETKVRLLKNYRKAIILNMMKEVLGGDTHIRYQQGHWQTDKGHDLLQSFQNAYLLHHEADGKASFIFSYVRSGLDTWKQELENYNKPLARKSIDYTI